MSKNIIVKYKNLEIICFPNTISKFRKGQLNRDLVLAINQIFKNAQKGNKASDKDIKKVFGNKTFIESIEEILHKGEFQLTSQERKELTQQKRNEILQYFHANYINPSNNLPHPITRYENAFTQLKINIDYLLPTDKQVREIHKKLSGIIPMKHKQLYLTISLNKSNRKHVKSIYNFAKVVGTQNKDDKHLIQVCLLNSEYQLLLDHLENVTNGDYQITMDS